MAPNRPNELRKLAAEAVRRYPDADRALYWLYREILCQTRFDDWRAALVEAEIRPLIEEAMANKPDAPESP